MGLFKQIGRWQPAVSIILASLVFTALESLWAHGAAECLIELEEAQFMHLGDAGEDWLVPAESLAGDLAALDMHYSTT